MIKRLIVWRTFMVSLFALVALQSAQAQDPVFSQFFNAPIQLNSALVGLSEVGQVSVNYRNQWPGWPQAYSTYSASYDQYFSGINSGLGAQILTDDSGDGILKTTKFTGVYSYQLRLNRKWQARVGLEAGFIQTVLDWDRLILLDQVVPGIINGTPGGTIIPSQEAAPANLSNIVLDIGMGGVLYSDKYYIGMSLKHINSPNNSFSDSPTSNYSGIPSRLTIHGGMEIDLDGYNNEGFGTFIAPSFMFTRQAGLSQLNAGALFNKENVFGGMWLRHTISNLDAAIFSFGLRTDWLKVSYSFDLTLSKAFVTRTTGSHEIGVIMLIGARKNKRSRVEDCFSLFR